MNRNAKDASCAIDMSTEVRHTVRLRTSVAVEIGPEATLLHHPWGVISISARRDVSAALVAMSVGELDAVAAAELIANGRATDDLQVIAGLAQLDLILKRLAFLVTRGVYYKTESVVKVEPISSRASELKPVPLSSCTTLSLDRVTYLRRRPESNGLCLESPLALHRAQLGQSLVPLIARIAVSPFSIDEIAGEHERASVSLLIAAGLIHTGGYDDVEDERLVTWSFHDLLFHTRSRPGRDDGLYGAHFRHSDRLMAPPAVPPARAGAAVDLPVPCLAHVIANERSLTEVIESRDSVREYAEEPLTIDQLAELLYRSARTRDIVKVRSLGLYHGSDHPYPTGGLAGDLELYICVARCTGLPPGIYHYESAAHRLRLVNGPEAASPLLMGARMASGGTIEPQVLLTITSRFARASWKYESIAYALTLKHVGALMQTVYLVATSMGLGPCALGSGDADQAARAFGLDWLVESSVGELMLGSRIRPVTWVDRFTDIVADTRKV